MININIPLAEVKSSQIHSIGYDPKSKTMAVKFHGKKSTGPAGVKGSAPTYHYNDVSPEQFAAFHASPSKYSHFYHNIKGKFAFSKVSNS